MTRGARSRILMTLVLALSLAELVSPHARAVAAPDPTPVSAESCCMCIADTWDKRYVTAVCDEWFKRAKRRFRSNWRQRQRGRSGQTASATTA